MLWAIVSILVLAIILFIVWRIVGLFIADQNIMMAIGLLFGLLLLLYALGEFMPGLLQSGHPVLPPSR